MVIISADKLVAGIKQEVKVCLHSGNTAIEDGSKVNVVPSPDLSITTSCHDNVMVLQEVARGGSCEWTMTLVQELSLTKGDNIDKKASSFGLLNDKTLAMYQKFKIV